MKFELALAPAIETMLCMCGIAGIIDFRGRPIAKATLQRFCEALAHRGPDDTGIWLHQSDDFSVGFAHTRLAVIDPTPEAHQPMTDPTGRYAITYNGELYNYRSLRHDLPHPMRTASDTEVALQACIAWGPKAVEKFDAMWALAFVDTKNKTGHLSRDPFGIKPLYYIHHDHQLIFASELSALRCVPDLPLELDPDALACYLNLGYIPHPQTIYRRVRKLPAGHRLCFSAQGPEESQRFYYLTDLPKQALPYEQAVRELQQRIETAVAGQRIADVPLGTFLSGGLDSSIVVACLSRHADEPVKTFSIGYTDHSRYDESHYAKLAADHFKTEHYEFRLGFKDVLDCVEPMLNHLGEPFADSSLLPTALVSQYTRQHVTVALSGDGGDELFGGYWRYLGHHYLARYHRWPAMVRKSLIEPLLRLMPSARTTRWLDRLRQARKLLKGDLADPMDRHIAWARHMDDNLSAELLGCDRTKAAVDCLNHLYRNAPEAWRRQIPESLSPLDRILLADLAVGLPADMLFKVDTASMYHSLEVRVPLLSADLVDFVAGLPIEYKIAGDSGKRILRDAFSDYLPRAILNRRKMGFEVPIGEFLRDELHDLYHDVVTPSALKDLNIDTKTAGYLYKQHIIRRQDCADLLWALLVLCWWKQKQ
ncbi:MAG: asparagine synthase (glutamine-hydrolyzing) [Planctomycetota bacterium]|nr:MAG: asparagine synthase (glutamine-hydrolyzing) [Planctomycetota bacterium]